MRVLKGWFDSDVGRVYVVKITNDVGRVLAQARVEVPLQPAHRLDERIGADGVHQIEQWVEKAAESVAHGVEANSGTPVR